MHYRIYRIVAMPTINFSPARGWLLFEGGFYSRVALIIVLDDKDVHLKIIFIITSCSKCNTVIMIYIPGLHTGFFSGGQITYTRYTHYINLDLALYTIIVLSYSL